MLPFYFKILIIINVIGFKTHLHYLNKQERTPCVIRFLLYTMYFSATIFLIALPIVKSDPAITDSQVRDFDLITMLTYLVPLSISSLCTFLKLRSGCLQAE